uniref:syntaxin-12-like isoform X1 n=1 Tax=Myxine glutinosa TaxID=7769 RepID=UPI00358DE347
MSYTRQMEGYSSYHHGSNMETSEEFALLTHNITTNIQKVSQNTSRIQRMMNQLGTADDASSLLEQLRKLQHDTNQLAKETNKLLKQLAAATTSSSTNEQVGGQARSRREYLQCEEEPLLSSVRQRRMQKEKLMNDFSSVLNSFQETQRRAAQKERETVAHARAASRHPANFFDETPSEGPLVDIESELQEQESGIKEQDLELIKEREVAIEQLEADIVDVNQIFKDLGTMIHDQGDMIDSIEANVESAEVYVQQGAQQLGKAANHQVASRKKICILVLVLSVIATILGIIIWQTTKS